MAWVSGAESTTARFTKRSAAASTELVARSAQTTSGRKKKRNRTHSHAHRRIALASQPLLSGVVKGKGEDEIGGNRPPQANILRTPVLNPFRHVWHRSAAAQSWIWPLKHAQGSRKKLKPLVQELHVPMQGYRRGVDCSGFFQEHCRFVTLRSDLPLVKAKGPPVLCWDLIVREPHVPEHGHRRRVHLLVT